MTQRQYSAEQLRLQKRYGPWAIVTGASDGIGRAFAEYLAQAGLNVLLVARRRELLESIANTLQSAYNIQTMTIAADLAQRAEVERVLHTAGSLDVGLLVAAAGYGTSGEFVDAQLSTELDMLAVNCDAVVAMSHFYAKKLSEKRRGGMVLFGSLVGFQGVARAANYAATKAFVQTLSEGLRLELAPLGVDVISSAPGPVMSGFGSRAAMNITSGVLPATVASQTMGALGRWGTVRPGLLSKLLEWSLSMLPRWGRVRMISVVMRSMTQHASEKN